MSELIQKYHLPHNSIRIDEFNFMLNCIDLTKESYFYEELRLLFLLEEIKAGKLKIFHSTYHNNLRNHINPEVSKAYDDCLCNPTKENAIALLNLKYSSKKTFKQVFNETVRDYTEFFAFLGLLPTYYKSQAGGDKKHFVSQRLKDYMSQKISLEQLIFDFKYRNSSKDYDSLEMYSITVRPYIIALKAIKHYLSLGYELINPRVISAIVLYSKSESEEKLQELFSLFIKPDISDFTCYSNLFESEKFDSICKELDRATLQLKPYLKETGYVGVQKSGNKNYYSKGEKDINELKFAKKVAFCNYHINGLTITPIVGKILYTLYFASYNNIKQIDESNLFDKNITHDDKMYILKELENMGCIKREKGIIYVSSIENQVSINPYTEFFDIEESNYVSNISELKFNDSPISVVKENKMIDDEFEKLRPLALGSNGPAYEKALYEFINKYFHIFSIKWYGANSTGKRLSDILLKAKIRDGSKNKQIAIIVECKAGNAVRAFDERKETDDIINTLQKEKNFGQIDGVWYWVVNGNSLPKIDEHGGYRGNELSKSFIEKLSTIQFEISEARRIPTIVTAFSFDAIKNYLKYLYSKTENIRSEELNKIDVPHFWRWSKKFMNLQYVMVYKDLGLME